MSKASESAAKRKPANRTAAGELILTSADISELGLDEAPADAGRSWEELTHAKKEERRHG
ncbi:MAG: hypothetical protein WCJ64_09150 [Rhodospirillaceae bacterium]